MESGATCSILECGIFRSAMKKRLLATGKFSRDVDAVDVDEVLTSVTSGRAVASLAIMVLITYIGMAIVQTRGYSMTSIAMITAVAWLLSVYYEIGLSYPLAVTYMAAHAFRARNAIAACQVADRAAGVVQELWTDSCGGDHSGPCGQALKSMLPVFVAMAISCIAAELYTMVSAAGNYAEADAEMCKTCTEIFDEEGVICDNNRFDCKTIPSMPRLQYALAHLHRRPKFSRWATMAILVSLILIVHYIVVYFGVVPRTVAFVGNALRARMAGTC